MDTISEEESFERDYLAGCSGDSLPSLLSRFSSCRMLLFSRRRAMFESRFSTHETHVLGGKWLKPGFEPTFLLVLYELKPRARLRFFLGLSISGVTASVDGPSASSVDFSGSEQEGV